MEQKDHRLAAIMYTGIAGFSRMMEADESGTLELVAYHNELIEGIAESHHGSIIKTIGDALLVDFKNTVEAFRSAMAIQDALYERNKENPGFPLLLRIGLHLGDIHFFENDALGEGINVAARLQALARPGCICLSQDIYNIVLNQIQFRAEKLGKVSLKNTTREIQAYEIASRNAEFAPDRDKPGPGRTPASSRDEDDAASAGSVASSAPRSQGTKAAPETAAPKASPDRGDRGDRGYSEESSRSLPAEIRQAILQDTKAMARRMTVDEARERYGFYGAEADEVIATMAEQGLIARGKPAAASAFPGRVGFGRNERGEFDRDELRNDIETAVQGIVSGIERSVERSMPEPDRERYREKYRRHAERAREHMERHRERDELRRSRHELKAEFHGGDGGPEERARDFATYKRRLDDSARKAGGGAIGHLGPFICVNAFLWFLNLKNSPSFHWAAIVTAGWGIGLVSQFVSAARTRAKAREIDAMPELDAGQLADYKKLNRMKDSMAGHLAPTIMVPLFLAVVNSMAWTSFPWFLIPTAAMLVGFLSHAAAYAAGKPRLERKILDSLGVKGGWRKIFKLKAKRASVSDLGPYAGLYREAETAKAGIAALLASARSGTVDADLAPSLDQYLEQVRLLAQSANEIDRLVEGIPMVALSKDRESLAAKEAEAGPSLKAEYRKSIEEIDRQEKSYQELKDQSEVVRLRLGSSVNQLKQMRIDIARLQAAPGAEGEPGLQGLKRRTDELSRYLEDLRSGYAESREDPFAELERAERERLAAEAEAKGELESPES